MTGRPNILITIDVEDWFQVENLRSRNPFSTWSKKELRVENNTHRLLDLFDSYECNQHLTAIDNEQNNKVQCTFFILGWIAERFPDLIREISNRGHEIASHGYSHNLCNIISAKELKQDLEHSRKLLEDTIGASIIGYRAPNFSINQEVIEIIREAGYSYDSSFNSFQHNNRYGDLDLSNSIKKGIAYKIGQEFYEIPISNLMVKNKFIPWGGGGYFRLFPFSLFKQGVKIILKREQGYMFYIHPWEIDDSQPRVKKIPFSFKFRHYHNLGKSYNRLKKFISYFRNCKFVSCSQYINNKFHELNNN